jgi:transcription elongation factor GreA
MPVQIKPTIPFTAEAYHKNQTEYDRLKSLRVEVMERLKAAREMGDLSENGAYKYAKFELGDIGRRMRYLKHVLTNGYVAEKNTDQVVVGFGTTVVLESGDRTFTFLLVSEHESDLTENKLSIASPIGAAIVGKKTGDVVIVATPKGSVTYTIVQIL